MIPRDLLFQEYFHSLGHSGTSLMMDFPTSFSKIAPD